MNIVKNLKNEAGYYENTALRVLKNNEKLDCNGNPIYFITLTDESEICEAICFEYSAWQLQEDSIIIADIESGIYNGKWSIKILAFSDADADEIENYKKDHQIKKIDGDKLYKKNNKFYQ